MNILFISHSFDNGGAQQCLYELVSYCKQEGDKCLVIGTMSGPMIKEYIDAGVSVKSMRLSSLFLGKGLFCRTKMVVKFFLSMYQIVRQIRQFRPHVVYTNSSCIIVGALAARLTRIRHIWHIHENFATFPARYILSFSTVSRIIACFSDRVIFASTLAMKSVFPGGCSKAVVVHNGVDSSRFIDCCSKCAQPDANDNTNEFTRVGFLGSLCHRRGLDILLKAFAIVKDKHPLLFLNVWGDGCQHEERTMMELAVSLGISESVKFNGYVDDVPKILPMNDVMVVPSRSESFSRITLEAMAAGLPVIATRCGGPEEFVVDGVTGLLVPCDNPQVLAKALEWVVSNPKLARDIGKKAKQQSLTEFRLEDKLHDIRKILCQVSRKQ